MNPAGTLSVLLRVSVEGGVLLLLIWAVTSLWPRMPAVARCVLWWLGSLRMLIGLLPVPSIPVVWRSPWVPSPSSLPTPVLELGNAMAGVVATTAVGPPAPRPALDLLPVAVLAVWAVGVLIGAGIMVGRLAALRRAWKRATPFADARLARWREEWAVVLGPNRLPEVRSSAEVTVPVAFGALRPGLLLPADSHALSDEALRMVLAHEMSHVRRGDPLLGWVPAIAQLAFWFHPLVRLAAREYLAAREHVCDADALRATGAPPRDYGALLLDYGVARLSEVPGTASCGSRGSRELKRRLDMLSRTLRIPFAHRVGAVTAVLAVAALAITPIRFVAANEGRDPSEWKAKRQEEKQAEKQELKWKQSADMKMKEEFHKSEASGWGEGKGASGEYSEEKTKRQRPPFAYMIKIKDHKGTRGSVDESDLESAWRLDLENRTALYFRIGDDMWVSEDPELIAEVTTALAPEDQFDESQNGTARRDAMIEEERTRIESNRAELERRKGELEAQRVDLQGMVDRRRIEGRATDDLIRELEGVESQMKSLWKMQRNLYEAQQRLSDREKTAYQESKRTMAERDAVHQQVLERVAAIAKAAVEDGRAERFVP